MKLLFKYLTPAILYFLFMFLQKITGQSDIEMIKIMLCVIIGISISVETKLMKED